MYESDEIGSKLDNSGERCQGKVCGYRMLLREIFQRELAAHFQVQLPAANMH